MLSITADSVMLHSYHSVKSGWSVCQNRLHLHWADMPLASRNTSKVCARWTSKTASRQNRTVVEGIVRTMYFTRTEKLQDCYDYYASWLCREINAHSVVWNAFEWVQLKIFIQRLCANYYYASYTLAACQMLHNVPKYEQQKFVSLNIIYIDIQTRHYLGQKFLRFNEVFRPVIFVQHSSLWWLCAYASGSVVCQHRIGILGLWLPRHERCSWLLYKREMQQMIRIFTCHVSACWPVSAIWQESIRWDGNKY